jgi:hypothetical protein
VPPFSAPYRLQIGYATSLTEGDVLNVIRALVYQMNIQLEAVKPFDSL